MFPAETAAVEVRSNSLSWSLGRMSFVIVIRFWSHVAIPRRRRTPFEPSCSCVSVLDRKNAMDARQGSAAWIRHSATNTSASAIDMTSRNGPRDF